MDINDVVLVDEDEDTDVLEEKPRITPKQRASQQRSHGDEVLVGNAIQTSGVRKASAKIVQASTAPPPLRPLTIAPKPPAKIAMKPLTGQQVLLVQGSGNNQTYKLISPQGQELNLTNISLARNVNIKPSPKGGTTSTTTTTSRVPLLAKRATSTASTSLSPAGVSMSNVVTSTSSTTTATTTTAALRKTPILMIQKSNAATSAVTSSATPTKTITLQQAQEMGLISSRPQSSQQPTSLTSGKHQTIILSKSGSGLQPIAAKTIKIVPHQQKINTAAVLQAATASNAKILPATDAANVKFSGPRLILKSPMAAVTTCSSLTNTSVGSSVVSTTAMIGGTAKNSANASSIATTSAPQTITIPPGQIIHVASTPALATGQLHQINIPGKGVQYIKFVAAPIDAVTCATTTSVVNTIKTVSIAPNSSNIILSELQPSIRTTKPGATSTTAVLAPRPIMTASTPKVIPVSSTTVNLSDIKTTTTSTSHMVLSFTSTPPALGCTFAKVPIPMRSHKIQLPPPPGEPKPTFATITPAIATVVAAVSVPSSVHNIVSAANVNVTSNASTSPSTGGVIIQSNTSNNTTLTAAAELESNGMRPRKPCNCTKSQCLKLYCDCFANGEFCFMCNCTNCYNNLEHEDFRQRAIKTCLERNPSAFRPKIGKAKDLMDDHQVVIRKHTKGCNCKRSGCLKNYCECYEAKIACSSNCKCFGCRNVEDCTMMENQRPMIATREDGNGVVITCAKDPMLGNNAVDSTEPDHQSRDSDDASQGGNAANVAISATQSIPLSFRHKDGIALSNNNSARRSLCSTGKQIVNFITDEVIEATAQCMLTVSDSGDSNMQDIELTKCQIIEEFGRCLTEIINYASVMSGADSPV